MQAFRYLACVLFVAASTGCNVLSTRAHADPLPARSNVTKPRMVGLWVTRWDFRRPEHIRQIVADAASLGVTDLFFQVRGQADALYRSDLEPWSELLLQGLPEGQTAPDFDPLALAIDAAHKRKVRLHAWINVMPLWKGATPPKDPSHAYHTRPQLRMVDRAGRPQPLHRGYVTVNPASPEVHRYLLAVVGDIARRYPVDGVHFDYIRFISHGAEGKAGYPADPTSHEMFRVATGLEADRHPQRYRQWIGARITSLVASLSKAVVAARPDAMVSAAVWRNPTLGRERYSQPYDHWMERRLVDAVMPMIYTADDAQFADDLEQVMRVESRADVIPGIGVYLHDSAMQPVRQMIKAETMGADGVCLFAYSSLFDSANPHQDGSPDARAKRSIRRSVLRAHLRGGE